MPCQNSRSPLAMLMSSLTYRVFCVFYDDRVTTSENAIETSGPIPRHDEHLVHTMLLPTCKLLAV